MGRARLVFHEVGNDDALSPFAQLIAQLVEGQDIVIACPYITTAYIENVVATARSWRLLSDVEEWLRAQGTDERRRTILFLRQHHGRVRHCADLHAKVVASKTVAMVGSANLTEKGLAGRQEMGVALEDSYEIAKLWTWFEALWDRTVPPDLPLAQQFVNDAPPPNRSATPPKLVCPYTGVRSQLVPPLAPAGHYGDTRAGLDHDTIERERARLAMIVRQMPSRAFAELFFCLVRRVQTLTGLTNDNPRWACTIRRDGSRLPVHVGNRYVCAANVVRNHHQADIGLTVPSTFVPPEALRSRVVSMNATEFAAVGDEVDGERMGYLTLRVESENEIPGEVWVAWERAALHQLRRAKHCPQRHRHSSLVAEVAWNVDMRRALLAEVLRS